MQGYIGGNSKPKTKKNYRLTFLKHIDHELESEQYVSRSKDGLKGVFSRNRKLTINRLIFFIMSFKTALQRDLDRLYGKLLDEDFNIREVTKGALTQARSKLNPWAFERLNEVVSDAFYVESPFYYTWYGMRTLAVDGSRLVLPNHPTVKEEFGVHGFGPNADSQQSLAMCSMLYDVLNQVTLDAQLAPYASSERDLLQAHLGRVKSGDLLLLDRGYPCFWVLFLLKAKGIEFCVRMKENWWLSVDQFVKSGKQQEVVEFTLPNKDHNKLSEYPEIINSSIKCRLIRVELDNGEIEVLCTSLLDFESYDVNEFKDLYHRRWNEEEAYKLLKSRAEMEKFSGKTARAVHQDFQAKVFLMTMCAAFAHPIEEKVREEFKADKNRKYAQKINRTHAFSTLMDLLVPMFLKKQRKKSFDAFDDLVYNTREIIRPQRSVKRKKKPKRPYYMNYKPL